MKAVVLDIGGTAIKSAVYENGSLENIRETPTEAYRGGSRLMETVTSIISSYREEIPFSRIGISTAGQTDPVSGKILYANENIPGYTGMPVREMLESTFHVPTAVENDVNSAAIGEAVYGAGTGEKDFVCLTYGTGVGGAIILNRRLYRGSSCSAGEFGAIITHPEDRFPHRSLFSGCYEKYASASALVTRGRMLDPTITDGRILFSRISEPAVLQLIDDWIMEVVYGLITITHMLNPSCIVLGGGVMSQPYILDNVEKKLQEHIMPCFRHLKIQKASLGNTAGMTGAGILACRL